MVTHVGHLATIHCKPRQARKGATVVMDSCAGERRAWVASNIYLSLKPQFVWYFVRGMRPCNSPPFVVSFALESPAMFLFMQIFHIGVEE